jgi:hypothetical protein
MPNPASPNAIIAQVESSGTRKMAAVTSERLLLYNANWPPLSKTVSGSCPVKLKLYW